jgi:hypothetical protein
MADKADKPGYASAEGKREPQGRRKLHEGRIKRAAGGTAITELHHKRSSSTGMSSIHYEPTEVKEHGHASIAEGIAHLARSFGVKHEELSKHMAKEETDGKGGKGEVEEDSDKD